MPDGVRAVAYADDLVLVVKARREEELEERANDAMARVAQWMADQHLQLVPEKTEAILLIGRKKCRPLNGLVLEGHSIATKKEVLTKDSRTLHMSVTR